MSTKLGRWAQIISLPLSPPSGPPSPPLMSSHASLSLHAWMRSILPLNVTLTSFFSNPGMSAATIRLSSLTYMSIGGSTNS